LAAAAQLSAAATQAQQMEQTASTNAGRAFGRSMSQYVARAQAAAAGAEAQAQGASAAAIKAMIEQTGVHFMSLFFTLSRLDRADPPLAHSASSRHCVVCTWPPGPSAVRMS
jgi:hypothetical protein